MQKYPIDFGYIIKRRFKLLLYLIIPIIMMFAGIILFIKIEDTNLSGFRYFGLFLLGILLLLSGIISSIIIVVKSMKQTFEEDKILKNTKDGMKNPSIRKFYWMYGIMSALGLVIAIWKDDETYTTMFVGFLMLCALLIWIYQKVIVKDSKSNDKK